MNLVAWVRAATRAGVGVMAATLVVSCSGGDSGPSLTVGAGNSAQSELIAQIYAQALSRAGTRTEVHHGLGQRGDYLAALDAGTVTLVGDDSGDLLSTFDSGSRARKPDRTPGTGPEAAADTTPTVADALSRALPEGLVTSDIADGTDLRPALVTTPAQ